MVVNVVKRGQTGTYRVKMTTKDPEGRWKTKWLPGSFATTELAEAKKKEVEIAITRGADQLDDATVAGYISEWLTRRLGAGTIGYSSLKVYSHALKRIEAHIGSRDLATLSSKDVQGAYHAIVAANGIPHAAYSHRVFASVMKDAANQGRILTNPMGRVDAPRSRRVRKATTLNPDQAGALIAASGGDQPLVTLLLATGMRIGEAAGLQWGDFDFQYSAVNIERIVAKGAGGWIKKRPKTDAGTRWIHVSKQAFQWFANQGVGREPHEYVFAGSNPHQLAARVKRALQRSGLGKFSVHDLRHAHATHLLRQNMSIKAVSRRLGHSDVNVTLSVYAHVMDGDDNVLAEAASGLVAGSP